MPQGVCRWRGQYTRLSTMQFGGDASDAPFVMECDEFHGHGCREHEQPPTKFAEDPESMVDVDVVCSSSHRDQEAQPAFGLRIQGLSGASEGVDAVAAVPAPDNQPHSDVAPHAA